MPIVLGGTGEVGSFGHLGDLYARGAQHAPPGIVNLNPDRGGGGGYGGGGQVTDAQVFAQQAQQAAAQQHAELQNWLMQQDMTQHEQMRLQQQQNAVAQLNGAVDSGSLSREEADQAIMQLRTGIDVGRQRMAATQQRHMQMQNQQLQHQVAQQESMEQENARFRAAGFPSSQSYSIEPQGEQQVRDDLSQWLAPGEQLSDRDVLTEAQRRGHVTRWHQHRAGQWESTQREGTTRDPNTAPVPGAMTEDTWQKHMQEIEKAQNERLHDKTDEERRAAINQAAKDRGLFHREDNMPSYRSYLESVDPTRRTRRLEGERTVQRIQGDATVYRQKIGEAIPDREYAGTLRGMVDRMEQTSLQYRGRPMPEIVQRRMQQMTQAIDAAVIRARADRADQEGGGPPPAGLPAAPPPGRPLSFGPGGYQANSLFGG